MMIWWNLDIKKNYSYYSFKYNTLSKQKFDVKTVQNLTVTGNSVQSAYEAINKANNLPEIQNFKWDAYYTCINATYDGKSWRLTYFDIIDTGYQKNYINVVINWKLIIFQVLNLFNNSIG